MNSVGGTTNLTARLFARIVDRQLKEFGVSSGMLPILFALCDGGELSQKALAEYAVIEQATMANTLNRMEREALIERRIDPADRRSQLISLTPDTMGTVDRIKKVTGSINEKALENLDETEQQLLLALLKKVITSLEAMSAKDISAMPAAAPPARRTSPGGRRKRPASREQSPTST